jgi:hypothetical protein
LPYSGNDIGDNDAGDNDAGDNDAGDNDASGNHDGNFLQASVNDTTV